MSGDDHNEAHVGVCVDELEYLERWIPAGGRLPGIAELVPRTMADDGMRQLTRIAGVTRRPARPRRDKDAPAPTLPLLTGACRLRTPVAFAIGDHGDGLQLALGVWSVTRLKPGELDNRRDALTAVLDGIYPEVRLAEAHLPAGTHERWGWAVGVPAALASTDPDENVVDCLARAMAGRDWSVLVLAQPAARVTVKRKRAETLEEIRRAEADTQGRTNPLIENYVELLTVQLKALNQAAVVGGWRVAVYLGAAADDFPRLSAAWTSLFSGAGALPDPIRVEQDDRADGWAHAWAMPDVEGASGAPSRYRHPFRYQSLLTSAQLAQYVQFPEFETHGFTVTTAARFDVSRPLPSRPAVVLGRVRGGGAGARHPTYSIEVDELSRHAFVAGVTGSGKTTTVFHLLKQLHDRRGEVPFLVLEPAKTEYRRLFADPRFADMRVFTVGNETVAPLRINPLQALPGTSVSEHLDLLKSLFTASFGMWSPMPQILERGLHEVYRDAGWDITQNTNPRLPAGARPARAFPTLSALHRKVEQIIDSLGYSGEVVSNIRAGLATRLQALCIGGKGRLLDTTDTIEPAELFDRRTVLELEAMGDDDDKAFVMGLVLIHLAEYRRHHGPSEQLRHLLVIEEAHRLLTNVASVATSLQGDPRGKAVEAFTNLLAEVRYLGQGVIVSDQVPTRLAPDVIKNTNLKIAHRIVAADDRAALGASMNMGEDQNRDLATLARGVAAVFSEGDDTPVQVTVPRDDTTPSQVRTDELRQVMAPVLARVLPSSAAPAGGGLALDAGRRLAADPAIERALTQIVISTVEDPTAIDRLRPGFLAAVRARRLTGDLAPILEHLTHSYAKATGQSWSAAYGWSIVDEEAFVAATADLIMSSAVGQFRAVVTRLLRRTEDGPFPRCADVCGAAPGPCVYRGASGDAVRDRRIAAELVRADTVDAANGAVAERLAVAAAAADAIIEADPGAPDQPRRHTRAGMCVVQHHLSRHPALTVAAAQAALHQIQLDPRLAADSQGQST